MITIPEYSPIYNVDLDFDGKLNNISIGQVNNLGLTAFTAEFWLKASSANAGTFLSYGLPAQPGIKLFSIENVSNLNIWLNNIQSTPTGVSVADNQWHFVAIIWQSVDGGLSVYVDGIKKWSGVLALGTSLITSGKVVIGQTPTTQGFDPTKALKGKVFNFRLWNKARTSFFSGQDMSRTVAGNAKTIQWQQNGYVTKGGILIFGVVAPGSTGNIYALDSTGNVQSSINFGDTFAALSPAPPVPQTQLAAATDWLLGIQKAPSSASTVWMSKNSAAWSQPSNTMQLTQASIQTGGTGLGINAANQLYSISNYGVAYSSPITTPQPLTWVSVNGTTAWGIGTDKKLYTAPNTGASGWILAPNIPVLLTGDVPVQVDILGTTVVVLTSLGLLYCSFDNGTTWNPILTSYSTAFTNVQLIGNTIWVINPSGQLLFAEINTKLVINLMCAEGYGDYAFDTSGNKNDALLGGGVSGGNPTWEVETQLTPPGFVDSAQTPVTIAPRTQLKTEAMVAMESLAVVKSTVKSKRK